MKILKKVSEYNCVYSLQLYVEHLEHNQKSKAKT